MLIHRAVAFVHVAVAGMEEWSMEQASEGGREGGAHINPFFRPSAVLSFAYTDGRTTPFLPTPNPPAPPAAARSALAL